MNPHPNRLLGRARLICVLAIALLAVAVAPSAASAVEPPLKVSTSFPDFVTPGKDFQIYVTFRNNTEHVLSEPVVVKYDFPVGVLPADARAFGFHGSESPPCTTSGQTVKCESDAGLEPDASFTFVTHAPLDENAEGTLQGTVTVSDEEMGAVISKPFSFSTDPISGFGVHEFAVAPRTAEDDPVTQGGSTPARIDSQISFLSSAEDNYGLAFPGFFVLAPTENFREIVVHLPPGLIGRPTTTPRRCTGAQLAQKTIVNEVENKGIAVADCPADSQIGLVQLYQGSLLPLYNIVPPSGTAAMFGFNFNGLVITMKAKVRPSDYGVDLVSETLPSSTPVPSFEVSFWGVPADPSHDRLRGTCLYGEYGYNPTYCGRMEVGARVPFLRTPTSCTGERLPWSLEADTYQHPATFVGRETSTDAVEGCERLPFDPSIALTPSERNPHAPSGLDVALNMPQEQSPEGLAEADLRSATVTLPQGVSINPASADGLAACSDAQLRLGQEGPSDCPDASKLGSVEVRTPLLEEPLGGSVFLRTQNSQDPASGEMYRLAIELRSDRYGLAIKLLGSLKVDPGTGQLTTEFDELPQLPFEQMDLHFKTGPRAPLTTPSICGAYTTDASLTSWSGKTVAQQSKFTIDQGCTAPAFAPGFEAGVENPTAGFYSPFNLRVTRGAGQPGLSRIDTTLPEGELAKLKGVPLCSDAQAATGACPASSRIGRAVVGVGEGSSPLYLPQPGRSAPAVYLAGPYKGGPYSVLVAVPAQAGPFDLGTVLVRSALHVDPVTTRVTVKSDPIPTILGGVPVNDRDVRVEIDRPGFTLNPTDCEPMKVDGTIVSTAGQSAAVSDRFQVGDCAALGFKPKLSLRLKGKTRRAGNPALTAVLTMPAKGPGANVARASVALPRSEFLDQAHIGTVCTRVQYAAGAGGGARCPKASVYGHARAFSPLLDRPLEGPVYLRSSSHPLPDLVASLGGQIQVDLAGRIDQVNGGIRTTFEAVPDAPVTKFVLNMKGGRKGLLENSTNICAATNRATAKFDAQNGRLANLNPPLKATCPKAPKKKR